MKRTLAHISSSSKTISNSEACSQIFLEACRVNATRDNFCLIHCELNCARRVTTISPRSCSRCATDFVSGSRCVPIFCHARQLNPLDFLLPLLRTHFRTARQQVRTAGPSNCPTTYTDRVQQLLCHAARSDRTLLAVGSDPAAHRR